ncbi:MAG: hypothetical protein IMW89_01050 [Ktedonobacteraceae bacterium]|nr:hypothetical protein [Ktedonobacteraceae bacterium]
MTLIDLSFIYFMAHLHIGRFLPFFPEFMIIMGFLLLNVVAFVGWIVGMVQAYRGAYYRLPVVGTIVANIMGTQAPLR